MPACSMKPDEILDLRGLPCPGNLPKLLIKLETMNSGEVLQLIVDDIVALDRIPLALQEENHLELLLVEANPDNNIIMNIKIK